MNIGESIRSIRESLKLTRNDVQKTTGINMNYLGQIERNESNPTIDILLKLANAYNVTVSELIGEVNKYSPKINNLIKKLRFTNKNEVYTLLNAFDKLTPEETKLFTKIIIEIKK